MRKGTPIGYKHTWKYKHLSETDNGKRFTYYQIKHRGKRARSEGGFKRGSKIIWNIQGIERITKTRNGYKHELVGIKRQGAFKIRGHRRWNK